MLHASKLAFIHPHTGKHVSFEAPWPEDFRDAIAAFEMNFSAERGFQPASMQVIQLVFHSQV